MGVAEPSGSWAFAAWGLVGGKWQRIGWEAASLPTTPWLPSVSRFTHPAHASFFGELAALEAAGLWTAALADWWQLHMGARPSSVTVAVDNSAALQIAAGHGNAATAAAQLARQAWQAVQSRLSTRFSHVHSHTGLLANSFADALAEAACHPHYLHSLRFQAAVYTEDELEHDFPWLWLLPRCCLCDEKPTFMCRLDAAPRPTGVTDLPESEATPPCAAGAAPSSRSVHVMTANIQTIKDAPVSIFNPSGLAARRQYLYQQVKQCRADIVCIQEARSRAGRWPGPGLLTWRSGALNMGVRCGSIPRLSPHPLRLNDCKILSAQPRLLCVTCADLRFPVTIISAHAPHADRPDREAREFWHELAAVTRRAPSHRALLVGLDANADFHAADPDNELIGSRLAMSEPSRNDDLLLEYCLTAGLEAPGTFAEVQQGDTWSWQHTSGRRKRIDHVLFRPGPWEHLVASQAFDFDIVNATRDHVALRVKSRLTSPAPPKIRPRVRRATSAEAIAIGGDTLGTHQHRSILLTA